MGQENSITTTLHQIGWLGSGNCIGERSGAKLSCKLAYSREGIPKSPFIPTVVVIIEAFLETVMRTRQGRDAEIPERTILWRAQLGVDYVPLNGENGEQFGEQPMGYAGVRMNPVAAYAREGRANSSGIPVLYLASTEQTAISEVRPWLGSEMSVAQFRVTRELNAIDLTQGHGKASWGGLTLRQISGQEEPNAQAKEEAVWIDIDNAFSRPVTLSDDKENYVATRILAELFREAGYDAIVYRSQFGQEEIEGYNVAIFELDDAAILNCAPYRVESINVNYEEFGNRWFAKASPPIGGENNEHA